ncbi:MAG TPA: DUF4350 domain-containing protein, partial [Acidobacteriaceae bacterium]|nr:DUF4350 domain-containing protein [Acidobacteriaceae bacterium]
MSAVLQPIHGQSMQKRAAGSRNMHLDSRDRRMLLVLLGLILALFALLAFLTPGEDRDTDLLPSSYLTGTHGAKAAYTLLAENGYAIERWQNPLSDLAEQAGPSTVLILAEPFPSETDDQRAVREILRKGGRVLATGVNGSLLLPLGRAARSQLPALAACEATPQGLSSLAAQGSIWINSGIYWKSDGPGTNPSDHIDYACGNQAVVVDYFVPSSANSASSQGGAPPGHAIWWASAMPLENGSIERGANLDLLLHSLGPPPGRHVYWDESLHSVRPSAWDFVHTLVWPLLLFGAAGLLLLVVFSFSRRSGPLRALPQPPRTTPIEFLDALGALYRSTGAASTALQIAFERFRGQAAFFTGQQTAQMDA